MQSGSGLIFMVLDPSLPQCPLIKQHIMMYENESVTQFKLTGWCLEPFQHSLLVPEME